MADGERETNPEPVVLIIADISGYTHYMTANAKSLAHGQALITELVKTILKEVDLPLKVAKLEGDAVFLFARKKDGSDWAQNRKTIGLKLVRLFEAFGAKASELSAATICNCTACAHIGKLKLKVIVHSGEALFHKLLEFEELAGVDVIIVHRLLKNSLDAAQYLLLTEAAQRDIELPQEVTLISGQEKAEGIGEIGIGVYYPGVDTRTSKAAKEIETTGERFRRAWDVMLKLWFKPLSKQPASGQGKFNHITDGSGQIGRIGFAALTAMLTPIYLPVGTLFAAAQAIKKPKRLEARPQHDHEHNSDGSCCNKG